MANTDNRFLLYLQALQKNNFQKLARLEFLQPDGSVAFSLDNQTKRGYNTAHKSAAFIQGGSLTVSMQNGQRRKATITLSNLDNAFDYNVNKVWFGRQIRLSMGLKLPDGTDFYLPQMVGYVNAPQTIFSENQKTVTFPLVDKWAYLDGTLAGRLANTYTVKATDQNQNALWQAITGLLQLSKIDHRWNAPPTEMIDNVPPVFTTFYADKTYKVADSDGSISKDVFVTDVPYDVREAAGSNIAALILKLVEFLAALVGYDQTGAFRVEPSQQDIDDMNKPVLWQFTPENSHLSQISETVKNNEVFNDVLIVGEGLTGSEVWGRAKNLDATSDTNVNLIGLKTYYEAKSNYWNAQQCADLAVWYLKRKTVLQKAVNITCSQMFHLVENRLVTVKRTDKKGSPTERHLINGFTIPIGETGTMTINATSVNDIPTFTTSYTHENLFTTSGMTAGYKISGTSLTPDKDYATTGFMPVIVGRTYAQSPNDSTAAILLDKDKNILSAVTFDSNGKLKVEAENAAYIRTSFLYANKDNYTFYLEY